MRERIRALAAALAIAAALTATGAGSAGAGSSGPAVGFSSPSFVDLDLAGGEPSVLADATHGTLVYTSHEGTTLLLRDGLLSPIGDAAFLTNYCNQVNVWVSENGGGSWQRVHVSPQQCTTDPTVAIGFSDPDLTMDAGGRIYNTGIDLVNDSLFSSSDGGRTWPRGTPNCHNGDRPWLAGGFKDEVFMSTNAIETGVNRLVFQSTDGGQTCSLTGIPDFGRDDVVGLDYTGFGKLYFDSAKQRLAEGAVYFDSNGDTVGLGVSTWKRGDARFTPHFLTCGRPFGFFPAITIDAANTIYAVWTPNGSQADCGGATPLTTNGVYLSFSKDFGKTWSKPLPISRPANAQVFWPWATAGDGGKIAVVWYQTAPGQTGDIQRVPADVSIFEATIFGASSSNPSITIVNASGRPVHRGTVCQGGTTCVVSGIDRRLGDYFTVALDARGCMMIASADTTLKDPVTGGELPTSRPIFIEQNAGPSLHGKGQCR